MHTLNLWDMRQRASQWTEAQRPELFPFLTASDSSQQDEKEKKIIIKAHLQRKVYSAEQCVIGCCFFLYCI